VRKGVDDLLSRPLGSGCLSDIEMNDLTPLVRDHHQYIEKSAGHGGNHKEVHAGNDAGVVAQKGPPALGRSEPGFGPILSNGTR
jgi:hypothetical protein